MRVRDRRLGWSPRLEADWAEVAEYAMLDHDYFLDALGSKLTELGRLAYVSKCIRESNYGPVHWATCQGDITALDFPKLISELRGEKAHTGADKMRMRIAIDEIRPQLASHAAKIKKLVASDPGYAELFKLAEATRKDWVARSNSDAALLALTAAMDDARAKTWAAWKAAVAQIPAKEFESMHADKLHETAIAPIVNNPEAYLASVGLLACFSINKSGDTQDDIVLRNLGTAMQRWPGFRGPRTAIQSVILGAGIQLDDRTAKIEYPEVNRKFSSFSFSGSGGMKKGIVSQLKPSNGKTSVEFKKQMAKVTQCAQWKETNHVTSIRPDGTFVYRSICLRNETITVNQAPAPQVVNERYAAGVKPGMFVSVVEDVVTGVWAKPLASAPTMVFGVPVK